MCELAIIVVLSRIVEQVTQQALVAQLVLFSLQDVEVDVATLSTAQLVDQLYYLKHCATDRCMGLRKLG